MRSIKKIVLTAALVLGSLGSVAGFAGPSHAATTAPAKVAVTATSAGIPFGIEVLSANGTIRGCYQSDGENIYVKHCNFGDGRQRFEAYLYGWYGNLDYTGVVSQGRNYLKVGVPGANGAGPVHLSPGYDANTELLFRSNPDGQSVIARASGLYPITNAGRIGSQLYSVRATGYGDYEVSLNTFNGVHFGVRA